MNIVLIGMRASGKTTVAHHIAELTGRRMVDMDEFIVEKVGVSIADYVARNGWEAFRDRESEVTLDVADRDELVIATGGGVILRPENVQALKKNGRLYWLTSSMETLAGRIGTDSERPPLTEKTSLVEELEDLYERRRMLYQSAADQIIDTQHQPPDAAAREIVNHFRSQFRNGTHGEVSSS